MAYINRDSASRKIAVTKKLKLFLVLALMIGIGTTVYTKFFQSKNTANDTDIAVTQKDTGLIKSEDLAPEDKAELQAAKSNTKKAEIIKKQFYQTLNKNLEESKEIQKQLEELKPKDSSN